MLYFTCSWGATDTDITGHVGYSIISRRRGPVGAILDRAILRAHQVSRGDQVQRLRAQSGARL